MKYYSAITINEVAPFAATWVNLEIIILSKLSQKEKYMWILKKKKKKRDANELIHKTERDSQI